MELLMLKDEEYSHFPPGDYKEHLEKVTFGGFIPEKHDIKVIKNRTLDGKDIEIYKVFIEDSLHVFRDMVPSITYSPKTMPLIIKGKENFIYPYYKIKKSERFEDIVSKAEIIAILDKFSPYEKANYKQLSLEEFA